MPIHNELPVSRFSFRSSGRFVGWLFRTLTLGNRIGRGTRNRHGRTESTQTTHWITEHNDTGQYNDNAFDRIRDRMRDWCNFGQC